MENNRRRISNANGGNIFEVMFHRFFPSDHNDRPRPFEPTAIGAGTYSTKLREITHGTINHSANSLIQKNASDEQGIPGIPIESDVMLCDEEVELELPTGEFEKQLESLSRTWMYDWILDLKDSDNPDKSRNFFWKGHKTRVFEGAKTVKLIREELQTIQINMVRHFLSRWCLVLSSVSNSAFPAHLDLTRYDCKRS
jgi:hypothetical protein